MCYRINGIAFLKYTTMRQLNGDPLVGDVLAIHPKQIYPIKFPYGFNLSKLCFVLADPCALITIIRRCYFTGIVVLACL